MNEHETVGESFVCRPKGGGECVYIEVDIKSMSITAQDAPKDLIDQASHYALRIKHAEQDKASCVRPCMPPLPPPGDSYWEKNQGE